MRAFRTQFRVFIQVLLKVSRISTNLTTQACNCCRYNKPSINRFCVHLIGSFMVNRYNLMRSLCDFAEQVIRKETARDAHHIENIACVPPKLFVFPSFAL